MNGSSFKEPTRSAQSATTLGFFAALARAFRHPKPERVSFFSVKVYFFHFEYCLFLKPRALPPVRILIVSQRFFKLSYSAAPLLVVWCYTVPFVATHHEVDAVTHAGVEQYFPQSVCHVPDGLWLFEEGLSALPPCRFPSSIEITSHPNASYLAPRSRLFTTLTVGPSICWPLRSMKAIRLSHLVV